MNELVKREQFRRSKELFDKVGTIIEKYCRENKLIIYGGLAMDKYLKNAGHVGIYDGFETIDYDVYSTNHVVDAEKLGKIIHESDVPYVKIHSGMSPTTRKINIALLSTSVIDINHISPEEYMVLSPTVIDGLYYIRTDALFEDQIKNVVTNLFADSHRIPKIINRLKLLTKYFPIIPETFAKIDTTQYISTEDLGKVSGIIAGDFAYNYYVSGETGGIPILYSEEPAPEGWIFPYYVMEGETIYEEVSGGLKLAPPALLLYFYFKMKITENTSAYDTQIYTLMQYGFPFPNYKEVSIYLPKHDPIRPKYENIATLWLA